MLLGRGKGLLWKLRFWSSLFPQTCRSFCVRRDFSEITRAVGVQGGCPGFSSWIWHIFYLTLSCQKSEISLASESDQERWPVCLQVDLLKICPSFPPRKGASSRSRLCGASTEQKPWGTSGESPSWEWARLNAEPVGASASEQERLPRQWKRSFASQHVAWPEDWRSGVAVLGWSPAPFFRGAPNGGCSKSWLCFQGHRKSTRLCREQFGPSLFILVLTRNFRMVLTGSDYSLNNT